MDEEMTTVRRLKDKREAHPMKSALYVVLLAALLGGAGCSTPSYMGKYPPCYEYTAQVLAMPSCQATMHFFSPCERRFTTEDGGEFYIGSPGADDQVRGFLGTLEEGKSYRLPHAFMEYRNNQEKRPNQ
jgi:hypothetical protein